MATWSKEELSRIAATDDLHIASFREDGGTYGTPTWIWSVAVDGALYVRGYNGQSSRWYQAAVRQRAGRMTAAGYDERGRVRADRRARDAGPRRRCLPRQIREQLVSQTDDRRSRSRCDGKDPAARFR